MVEKTLRAAPTPAGGDVDAADDGRTRPVEAAGLADGLAGLLYRCETAAGVRAPERGGAHDDRGDRRAIARRAHHDALLDDGDGDVVYAHLMDALARLL